MDLLKRLVELIFSPLGITSLLLGAGIVLSFTKRHSQAGHRFLICGGLLFWVLLCSPLSEYMVLRLEREYAPVLKPPTYPRIDRIVVLAGYAEEHSDFPITANVSQGTICTTSEGLRLYRLLPGAKLIMSGGVVREGEKPVAASMAEFLRQTGVPESDVLIEGNSQNTYENLLEVNKLVGSNPFIMVAQACDLRRAMAVARKLHMNPVPVPACNWALQYHTDVSLSKDIARHMEAFIHPSAENLTRIQWAYHEYLGYIWYRLLGRI